MNYKESILEKKIKNNLLMGTRFYTKEEDEYLRRNYLTKSKAEMAKEINRTPKSIEKRLLSVLKLKKSYKDMGLTRRRESGERNNKLRNKLKGQVPEEWFTYPSSHDEATRLQSDYYFTGRKCENGHLSIRRTAGRGCLGCDKKRSAIQRKNPDWQIWRRKYRKTSQSKEIERRVRRERMKDPAFHIRVNASARIASAMKRENRYKPVTAEKLIGCNWDDFIIHVTNQFSQNMRLDNYGLDGWHLDHIRPCDSFNLLEDEQLYVCFNWRNYQPLWGSENLEKQNFYTEQDEKLWINRMRKLGYEGSLFPIYE